jgi:hypothetical protein
MAGRPPKPTELLLLTGAGRKNPKRIKARAGEPQPPGPIGGPPAKWMIFHPDTGYGRAEKLRAIWDNCIAMWPWVSFSDRDALEGYCLLKLQEDQGTLSGSELTALMRARTELGGTGSGRARLGIRGNLAAPSTPKASDPRVAFLDRKFG